MNIKLTAFIIILLGFLATSCHKSTVIKLNYHISLSDELADIADVEVTYTDFEGNEHREIIQNGCWDKTLTTHYPPVSSKIRVETSRNANTVDDKQMLLGLNFSCSTERYLDGDIMESVVYTEYFDSHSNNNIELVNALQKFDFERSYVIRSASDSSITMEQFKIFEE